MAIIKYKSNGIWKEINQIKGDVGQDGKSSYQIWLDLGNVGTKEEFIEILKGQDGIAGQQGEIGLPGTNGAHGIKGDKGDIGFKGDKGGQGIQGLRGEKGEKGEKGDSGIKPIIPCTSWGVILGNVAICWGKGGTNEHGEYSLQYPTIEGRKVSYDDEAILTATYEEMLSSNLIPLRAYGGSGAWGLVRGSDHKTIMWQSVGKLIDSREAEEL